jgi:hypothetical protein
MATAAILKNQPLKAQLHMAYDIPTKFHKVWSKHLREIERIGWTNFAAVAIETKKGGFKKMLDSFHQTS